MSRITDVVKHLIIINVIFFVGNQLMNGQLGGWFALFFPQNPNFGFWQFLTHMFMHGGFMHILFNMYALWAFGSPLEQMWGKQKFAFFYFSSGLGAALVYTGVNYFQFNSIYQDLLAAGMSSENIQALLETGRYTTDILDRVSEQKLSEFYQIFNTPAVGASGAVYGCLLYTSPSPRDA